MITIYDKNNENNYKQVFSWAVGPCLQAGWSGDSGIRPLVWSGQTKHGGPPLLVGVTLQRIQLIWEELDPLEGKVVMM